MGKIAVLGLGPSLSLYNPADYNLAIGVNDIWRYHQSEAIVCLNHRSTFNYDRLNVIDNSKPKAFYTQIANWNTRPDFVQIELTSYFPNHTIDLNIVPFYKSYCSPFVACQVGIRFYQAKEIHLFGVDLVNHPHLDQTLCTKIKNHFLLLSQALEKEGCEFIVHGSGILSVLL